MTKILIFSFYRKNRKINSFYLSNPLGDNILKLYFECSLLYLEDFIFKMYNLVEDIPYLEDIFKSNFLEYMQYNSIIWNASQKAK